MNQSQVKITITEEQQNFIREHKDKMTIVQLSKRLSIPINKLGNNLRIMGLTRRNGKREDKKGKVVEGYFDFDNFFKAYNY